MEDNYEHRICVVDSYPGSGKTSYAIQKINQLSDDVKVIYITPYLGEVQRIIDSCPDRNFVQPDAKIGTGSKMRHLIDLVNDGTNIVSTHALFTNTDDADMDAIRGGDDIDIKVLHEAAVAADIATDAAFRCAMIHYV